MSNLEQMDQGLALMKTGLLYLKLSMVMIAVDFILAIVASTIYWFLLFALAWLTFLVGRHYCRKGEKLFDLAESNFRKEI